MNVPRCSFLISPNQFKLIGESLSLINRKGSDQPDEFLRKASASSHLDEAIAAEMRAAGGRYAQ
jgi:hypothetical protein